MPDPTFPTTIPPETVAARIRASLDAGATLISTETGIPHQGEAGPSFKNIQRAGFRIVYERPNMRRA